MERYTGITSDGRNYHFTFRLCPACDGTRLEWPVNTGIMLLSQDLVAFLEGKGYSRGLVLEEVEAYNEAVSKYLEADGAQDDPEGSPAPDEGEIAPSDDPEGDGAPSEEEPPVATDDEADVAPPAEPEDPPASIKSKSKKG